MYNCDWFLDFVHRRCIYSLFESSYNFMVSIHSFSFVSSHHNLRLRKNFHYSASKPNSCSEPCCSRTTEPSNSIEHSSIQKGSVQCTVGAGNNGYLLSAVCYSSTFDTSSRDVFIPLPCFAIYGYFSVFELVIKPIAVLLEDQRSKASCKSNIKATFLSIELAVFYAWRSVDSCSDILQLTVMYCIVSLF